MTFRSNEIIDNEMLLIDRLGVIRDTIAKYGEENFYLSFSGGKDSTIVSYLLDMAIPGNKIPRVFINTGIEYHKIVEFVRSKIENDNRYIEIQPIYPIKETLEKYGYPFKSKEHSNYLGRWQRGSKAFSVIRYKNEVGGRFTCPDVLKYQFAEDFALKVSEKCCDKLKKEPVHKWEKENGRKITITGMRKDEGGKRSVISCITTRGDQIVKFHPLAVISDAWENWLIERDKIQLCDLYYEPYNFQRTGCKGCPYSLQLQNDLETMEKYMPAERKQCEWIWKPVYEEYRRLGYRLKKTEQIKLL